MVKKILFLLTFMLITLFPLNTLAEVINGSATIASGVIYSGSSYAFTPNINLSSNSENVYRYSTNYNDPFIMGVRYVSGVNLGSTGADTFSGVVQIPVAIYNLNTVTVYNRPTANDFHIGLSNEFWTWNLTPNVTSFTSNCGVYYNIDTSSPYNICVYTINFTAKSNNMIYGGTNFSFSLYDWSSSNRLVFQPLGGSWGNDYGGWIFPKNPTNIEGASNISPTFILSYGNNVSETLLQQQIQQNQQIIDQNQTIINQQNENTQDIIDNQNQNKQDIIDNQNANTDKEIESQKVCSSLSFDNSVSKSSGFLTSSGSITNSSNYYHSDYIPVNKDKIYTLSLNYQLSSPSYCLYSFDKTLISCTTYQSRRNISIIPFSDGFIRYSLNLQTGNNTIFTGESCINGNQALNDSVNDLNDNITSESQPNTNQDISDMNDMVASDTPISDLITMPLTLVNAYINGINSACSPVNLGNLYGTDLILPCINLESRLGSNLWSMIDTFFCIFMCYNIGMLFVTAFDGITSLRDDFEGLYQPRHSDVGYQPRHGGGN